MNYENEEHYAHEMDMQAQAEAEMEAMQAEAEAQAEQDRIEADRDAAAMDIERLDNMIDDLEGRINELRERRYDIMRSVH